MIFNNLVGIIADDLTGANDTALQFFMKGSNTEIILGASDVIQNHQNVDTWAYSTETRNIDAKDAAKQLKIAHRNRQPSVFNQVVGWILSPAKSHSSSGRALLTGVLFSCHFRSVNTTWKVVTLLVVLPVVIYAQVRLNNTIKRNGGTKLWSRHRDFREG